LGLLTPTTNEGALAWRAECRKTRAKTAINSDLKLGDKITFAVPFSFGRYGKAATFTLHDKNKNHWFAHEIGIMVKLNKRNLIDYTWDLHHA
jgi:hypothetical protein